MSRAKPTPPSFPVEVEVDGKIYRSTYTVEKGPIRVTSSISYYVNQVGGSPPASLDPRPEIPDPNS